MAFDNFDGYNPAKVAAIFGILQSSYNEVRRILGTDFQSKVVDTMATGWFAPEAQTHFKSVKVCVEEEITEVNKGFAELAARINEAARIWAQSSKREHTPRSLSIQAFALEVGGIKEINGNGDRGIVLGTAETVMGTLPTFLPQVMSELQDMKTQIAQTDAFLGGSQMAAIERVISNITSNVSSNTQKINDDLKQKISDTIQKYKILAAQAGK